MNKKNNKTIKTKIQIRIHSGDLPFPQKHFKKLYEFY